jgi:hypothetical protein
MKHTGTITRIQPSRDGVTIIINTNFGPRGVEFDREEWLAIVNDLSLTDESTLVGWTVEYNPATGEFEIIDDSPSDADG